MVDQRTIVDVACKAGATKLATEIGALLGQELTCSDVKLDIRSKESLFSDSTREKTVLTRMDVTGDREGDCFLLTRLDTSITLAGTLIMLPEDMIKERIASGCLDGEMPDAFGEIANIIAGVFTQAFVDNYPESIRFIKKTVEELILSKIDIASDDPFPPGNYFSANCILSIGDKSLGPLEFIIPTEVFALEDAGAVAAEPAQQAQTEAEPAPSPEVVAAPAPQDEAAGSIPDSGEAPIVLVISERQNEADPFVEILSSSNCTYKVLSFQDDIKTLVQQHQLLGIFLIMPQVSEKGFAIAIKLQSARKPAPPLIFVAPDWTRSTVMRAVKYGARDILMLPASDDEIQEKISHHILKAS